MPLVAALVFAAAIGLLIAIGRIVGYLLGRLWHNRHWLRSWGANDSLRLRFKLIRIAVGARLRQLRSWIRYRFRI